ncbi:MAG: glycosyltransferase family 39 protein, partial [Chloroflexi bacterium]|nr:glycosyltransferase family 39 protein [Chloroflexota bacterium]
MGIVEQNAKEKRLWFYLFLAGLIAGLILRFYLASFAKMPGHGDSAFYYTVAKNIALGRGPVIDYIVYFFSGLLPLPHYAGDFWNPTAAYLIAIPMVIFKNTSIQIALIAPILAGIVPAAVGYLAGKKYSGSIAAGALAGVLTFFSPFQVWFSTTTEAIIFSGAFGALSLYFMMKGNESPRNFLIAAIFTGLANLIRQDNVLLLGVLGICMLLASIPLKSKLIFASLAVGIHLLILSPLLIKNYAELGAIFPPGPAKTAFLTTYEDFHSYNKEIDWRTLRATLGIRGVITKRLHTAWENIG